MQMCWSAVAFNPAVREARGRIQSVTHHRYLHKHVLNFICMKMSPQKLRIDKECLLYGLKYEGKTENRIM